MKTHFEESDAQYMNQIAKDMMERDPLVDVLKSEITSLSSTMKTLLDQVKGELATINNEMDQIKAVKIWLVNEIVRMTHGMKDGSLSSLKIKIDYDAAHEGKSPNFATVIENPEEIPDDLSDNAAKKKGGRRGRRGAKAPTTKGGQKKRSHSTTSTLSAEEIQKDGEKAPVIMSLEDFFSCLSYKKHEQYL